ncbi:MAG: hypothetical protein ACP5RC_06035 [Halothiobacillaceae bacterium]
MADVTSITVWPGCDPQVADAIAAFSQAWGPYSAQSRRYSIFRLLKEKIDPAWQGLLARFPVVTSSVLKTAWARYELFRSRAGTTVNSDGNLIEISDDAHSQRLSNGDFPDFKSLALIGQQYGFNALDRFIYFVIRSSPAYEGTTASDITLTATLDSLRNLALASRAKKPKREYHGKVNTLRGVEICRLCDQPTELSAHLAGDAWPEEDIDDQRLRLSSLYCCKHKPKKAFSDAVRADYLRAKRNQGAFDQELERLDRQSWAGTAAAYAKSGNTAVDEYIRLLSVHRCLTYEQQPPDRLDTLETRLRWEARMLVDRRISDRKKEIIALLSSGMNQSEVARQLGIERQAISKALHSVPQEYRVDQLCNAS